MKLLSSNRIRASDLIHIVRQYIDKEELELRTLRGEYVGKMFQWRADCTTVLERSITAIEEGRETSVAGSSPYGLSISLPMRPEAPQTPLDLIDARFDLTYLTIMGNAYIDFDPDGRWRKYL